MSITFTYAASDGEHEIIGIPCALCESLWAECGPDADWEGPVWRAYFDHADTCPTKQDDLNLSNTNAARLMDQVGIPFDYVGTIEADKVMRLINDNCTWKVGKPGYDGAEAVRILRLFTLANEAHKRGCKVGWS